MYKNNVYIYKLTIRRNMNNLKKVGLSALAGSMVAFSAQAMEMSVSGTAKITYVDEGEGSAGNTDVTGNPYGFDQTIGFNGSGDSPIGTVSLMHVANTNGSRSSSLITIDMGDAGKVSLDGGVGNSGAGTIKDMMPRAAGAEQSWDDTDGDKYFIDTPSQSAWGYDNSFMGFDVSLGFILCTSSIVSTRRTSPIGNCPIVPTVSGWPLWPIIIICRPLEKCLSASL